MLRGIFGGFCMGAADLVPGISGGTMAFVLGFYEKLIHSIKDLRQGWRFLLLIVIGAALAIVSLSRFIHYLLNDPVLRAYLFSSFIGFVLGAVYFCGKRVGRWQGKELFAFIAGASGAALLTGSGGNEEAAVSFYGPLSPMLLLCGVIGVAAMLLPGISGSYMMAVLGVYPLIIGSLVELVDALQRLSFDAGAFAVLANLGAGIIVGALLFSRLISWLLSRYRSLTLALLTGFMVGALRALWPFWSYSTVLSPFRPERGPQLKPLEPLLPDPASPLFWKALICCFAAFLFVFLLELLASKSSE